MYRCHIFILVLFSLHTFPSEENSPVIQLSKRMELIAGIKIGPLPNLFCMRRLVETVGQEHPCLLGLEPWPACERASLQSMRRCSCLHSCAPHICEILLQQTWLVCMPLGNSLFHFYICFFSLVIFDMKNFKFS